MFFWRKEQDPDPFVGGTERRPDPYQYVTDLEHWYVGRLSTEL